MSSPSEPPSGNARPEDLPAGSGDLGPAPEFPQVPPPPPGALGTASQRLHPAALGVWALGGAGPLVLLLVAGSLNLIVAGIMVLVAAVGSLARWLRFRWRLEADALVIEQGVLQRRRRVIPLERIQSVEAVRKLGHRVFGVVELRVETIGGGSTEGQLDALDPEVAARLRRDLLRKGADRAAPREDGAPSPTPLVRMRPGQLVAAGLTGGRVGVFAAMVGFASQALGERTDDAIEWLTAYVGGTGASEAVSAALLLAAGTVAVAFLLSVVATTLTYWDFTLTRDGRDLHTTRGLLDQRSGTIPLHRVQSVRVEENALRRLLGLASVKVEVAGHVGGDGSQETSTVLPLGKRREAVALAGTILGRDEVASVPLRPMPTGARDRRFVRAAVATVAVAAPLTWWLGTEGVVGLAAAAPFALLASASYRALGHAESDGLLLTRSGVLVRRTYMTLERSLQATSVTSTPFQRRRGLATLVLHIARSPRGGGDPTAIDVSGEHARAELWRLAAASDETARQPLASAPSTAPSEGGAP